LPKALAMRERRSGHPIEKDPRGRGGEYDGNPITKSTREASLN
jgi:hypothetical protein